MGETLALVDVAGRIRDSVAEHLGRSRPVVTADAVGGLGDLDSLSAVVTITRSTDPEELYRQAWTATRDRPVAWLNVDASQPTILVSPAVTGAGCHLCCARRRRQARANPAERASLERDRAADLAALPDRYWTRLAAATTAGLILAQLTAVAGVAPLSLDLPTMRTDRHEFLPDPTCPLCGGLPADRAEDAVVTLLPRPKPGPRTLRSRDLDDEDEALRRRYVDPVTGFIRSVQVRRSDATPSVAAGAELSARTGDHALRPRIGWGRTFRTGTAVSTAIAEALERFGGERPGGRRTAVRGSYRDLGQAALDPRTLGLYPDERYDQPGFSFRRYTEDLVTNWVWGYSFGRRSAVLVPENCAYYRVDDPLDRPFVYEISNGCALGGSLEEAILHGILEVAERDAFLLTWYARLGVPRVDPRSAADRGLPLLVECLRQNTGYEIGLFNTTVEQGIPCFWVMGVDRTDDPARPKVLCAAGSSLYPEKAAVNALHELAPMLDPDSHRRNFTSADRMRAAAMVRDPSLVRVMADHSLLYGHPDAFDRFAFLLEDPPQATFADVAYDPAWGRSLDLAVDARSVIDRYLASGLDVVVVDQTTPELAAGGFACVKVLIPGTLPMTFGYAARRTDGLARLASAPVTLGHRSMPLEPAEVNPHPHPFP